jgi:hypothetical protein
VTHDGLIVTGNLMIVGEINPLERVSQEYLIESEWNPTFEKEKKPDSGESLAEIVVLAYVW